jgi:hypothetical protein
MIAGMEELAPNPDTHRTPRGPRSDADWMNALRYYKKLSELGLAPGVLKADHKQIVARWHEPLPRWRPAHSEAEWQEMGLMVLARVEELHSHGICHRDLHVGNVVVHDGVPLFIDMEFGLRSDPAGVCYDLVGPERSGIAVPDRHAVQANANRNGVWWDADNREVETLGRAFGSVAELSQLLTRRGVRGR